MAEEPFLLALERSTPVPGGGSAAAYAASVGLALLDKIVRLESERPRSAPKERREWEALLDRVRRSAEIFRRLREEDSEAYVRLAEARRSKDERAIHRAWEQAIACPVGAASSRDCVVHGREVCSARGGQVCKGITPGRDLCSDPEEDSLASSL